MKSVKIALKINGTVYRVCATDSASLKSIPDLERQQLIELLEAIQREDRLMRVVVQPRLGRVEVVPSVDVNSSNFDYSTVNPERVGSGDVDDLVNRLIMEERSQQGSPVGKKAVWWLIGIIGIILGIIILL